MSIMSVTARLYGGSLYDLAVSEGLEDVLLEQTGQVRLLLKKNPEYVKLLSEPSIPKKERTDLLENAFGNQAEHYLVNFLKLLCEQNIMNEYAGCCEEYERRYNADHNIVRAKVTSVVELNEMQIDSLQSKLEQLCGKRVFLTLVIDPSVIGGLKVELDGKQLDGTVQGRLTGLSRKIREAVL